MIDHRHLRRYVIYPVLEELQEYYGIDSGGAAVQLLVLTAATESQGGKLLCRHDGRAYGIYGMRPEMIRQVMERSLTLKLRTFTTVVSYPRLLLTCRILTTDREIEAEVCSNLAFVTALARLHYHYAIPETLPPLLPPDYVAHYWKQYWNKDGAIRKAIDDDRQYMNGTLV